MDKFNDLKTKILALEEEAKKFFENGNKSAGTRLRKGLQEAKALSQELRNLVTETKNAES